VLNHAPARSARATKPNSSAAPNAQPASTSLGKCTPRYIREMPIRTTSAIAKTQNHHRRAVTASIPHTLAEICEWPDGNPKLDSAA